jgi:hypothetical protein
MSPRRFRILAGAAAVAVVGVVLVSARWEFELGVVTGSRHTWSTALRRGQIELWRDNAQFDDDSWDHGSIAERDPGVHMRVGRSYYSQVSAAWRPYHAKTLAGGGVVHGIVVPLWPLVLLSLVLAGYAHGVVVGERRATIGRCRGCGYDIRGVRPETPCPECGRRTPEDTESVEVHVKATESGAATSGVP